MPFMPPITAYTNTTAEAIRIPAELLTSRKRSKATPAPLIWPMTEGREVSSSAAAARRRAPLLQERDDGHQAGTLAVEAVTHEIRHGELAELAQVGSQQHGQQHVATGPAHQEGGVDVTDRDQAGHGDE